MALPPKTGQIDSGRHPGAHWNVSIQPFVRAVIVEIALIVEELSVQAVAPPAALEHSGGKVSLER